MTICYDIANEEPCNLAHISNGPSLHPSTTPLIHQSTPPPLHHSITPSLHQSIHHSTPPPPIRAAPCTFLCNRAPKFLLNLNGRSNDPVNTEPTCPVCGARIPPEAPDGQCVNCLLQVGLRYGGDGNGSSLAGEGVAKRFGDFELLNEIGRGGMGTVWRARQVGLRRTVALKLLLGGQFASETALRRFEFEAEAAANLDHPNIVPIYEAGEHEGWAFLAMKLVEGRSLAQRMSELSLPNPCPSQRLRFLEHRPPGSLLSALRACLPFRPSPAPAASDNHVGCLLPAPGSLRSVQTAIAVLMAKIARAVHFAHQRGLLHRDLKPSNILIDAQGEPHITDFGVARQLAPDGRLTQTGALLGSPHYMAPEQASGTSNHLTTAADTYSLGVILFELLTGRLPFAAGTVVATLKLVLEAEPPRPRALNPSVDADLQTICLKCLEKDPSRRYRSAEALAEDLDRWREHRPIQARRANPIEVALKWVRREPLKASLIGLILAFIAAPLVVRQFYADEYEHLATEHPVATTNEFGAYSLLLNPTYHDDRCTENFYKLPFTGEGSLVRLEVANLPPKLAASLRWRIRADWVGLPDPARSPVLTNGQVFRLRVQSWRDRDFYVASIGWRAKDLVPKYPNATVRLLLLPQPQAKR